jgi:hypothetical protein
MCSSVIGTKREPFCFCLDVNSARISGTEQPIKLLEKHYPPPEYMLNSILLYATRIFILQPCTTPLHSHCCYYCCCRTCSNRQDVICWQPKFTQRNVHHCQHLIPSYFLLLPVQLSTFPVSSKYTGLHKALVRHFVIGSFIHIDTWHGSCSHNWFAGTVRNVISTKIKQNVIASIYNTENEGSCLIFCLSHVSVCKCGKQMDHPSTQSIYYIFKPHTCV